MFIVFDYFLLEFGFLEQKSDFFWGEPIDRIIRLPHHWRQVTALHDVAKWSLRSYFNII